MTEIKVIVEAVPVDIAAQSTEERRLLLLQVAGETDLPSSTIDNFLASQEDAISMQNSLIKPDLDELLLRKSVKISKDYAGINAHIIPLIPSFKEGGGMSSQERAEERRRLGTVLAPHQTAVRETQSLRVRFDSPTLSITADDSTYMIPTNEEVVVIGVIFTPFCVSPQRPSTVLASTTTMEEITAMYIETVEIAPYIANGAYSVRDAVKACDNVLMRPLYTPQWAPHSHVYTFGNIHDILSRIFDYLRDLIVYHNSGTANLYVREQVNSALDGDDSSLSNVLAAARRPSSSIPLPAETPLSAAVRKAGQILNINLVTTTQRALLADLQAFGVPQIAYGEDAAALSDIAVRIKHAKLHREQINKRKEADSLNKLYKMIVEKKLGAQRLNEVEQELRANPALLYTTGIASLLKPNERKIVELEYGKREKYIYAAVHNTCPHVAIYKQFRNATTDQQERRLFDELVKFMDSKQDGLEMIRCNNCGFDLMCPHVRVLTEAGIQKMRYVEVRARLSRYVDRGTPQQQVFCIVCGELVQVADATLEMREEMPMDEELKNLIWGEIAILMKHVHFDGLTDVPRIITHIRNVIYPYVAEVERNIMKAKTALMEEIKAKRRLFIVIYAFAYIIHLILTAAHTKHGRAMTFRDFKGTDTKRMAAELMKHAINLILVTYNVIIRQIPNMSPELIKNKLIESYKVLSDKGQIAPEPDEESYDDMVAGILLDPIYKYIARYSMQNAQDSMASILNLPSKGKSHPAAPIDMYGDVEAPPARGTIQPLTWADLADRAKFAKTYWKNVEANAGIAFALLIRILRERVFAKYAYTDITTKARHSDPLAPIEVTLSDDQRSIVDANAPIRANERAIVRQNMMMRMACFGVGPWRESRRSTSPHVTLGRVYDEDGSPHVWSIFIVESAGKQVEISRANPIAGRIVDKKCSRCQVRASQIEKLDQAKIAYSLSHKHKILNFFRFYEGRCPVGDLHVFAESKCKKCGISLGMYGDPHAAASVAVYEKYAETYDREFAEFSQLESRDETPPVCPTTDAKYLAEYKEWTFDFDICLDLAGKTRINHRLLMSLGAIERQEYADVLSGAYIPPEAEHVYDTRIYVLDSHIKNLMTDYNILRYFGRAIKPPADIASLIEGSNIDRHKIDELAVVLPEVFNDYNARLMAVKMNMRARDIVSFCVQSLCEMCLRIWDDTNADTEKLRHDFVDHAIKKIFRGEELLTKPGYFNWSLLYGDKEAREKEGYDMNYGNVDSETDKGFDESSKKDDDFGDTSAPLQNEFDMETDGEANEWRVGENIGLD